MGPNYLEIDLDVHNYAFLARKALWSYHDRLPTVVWDMGFVIQVWVCGGRMCVCAGCVVLELRRCSRKQGVYKGHGCLAMLGHCGTTSGTQRTALISSVLLPPACPSPPTNHHAPGQLPRGAAGADPRLRPHLPLRLSALPLPFGRGAASSLEQQQRGGRQPARQPVVARSRAAGRCWCCWRGGGS